MKRIMLDLETMGTRPGCAILQIGAVEFCEVTGLLGREFYSRIDLMSCCEVGLKMDPSTVLWWMGQGDAARSRLTEGDKEPVTAAVARFHEFLRLVSDGVLTRDGSSFEVEVWGNSSTFDNSILGYAYESVGGYTWVKYGDRCYRTLKNLFPDVLSPVFEGVKHNALDDAKHQARHAIALLRQASVCCRASSPADPFEQNRRSGDAAAQSPAANGDLRQAFSRVQAITDKELSVRDPDDSPADPSEQNRRSGDAAAQSLESAP